MTKGSDNIREGSRCSYQHEKRSRDVEDIENPSLVPQKCIKIEVQSIENVDENKIKEIMITIEFNGAILSQYSSIPITNKWAEIQMNAIIEIDEVNPQFFDDILANPVLFTVMDSTARIASVAESLPQSSEGKREGKKKQSKASNSSKSNSKHSIQHGTILGICNLDIGSLATGKKVVKDTLLLEPEKKLSPPEIVPWGKLPKLTVMASTGDEPLISESQFRGNNIIGVTIESVYNFPTNASEATFFDAIIPVPSIGDKTRRIKFSNGETTSTKDPISRKKWLNLSHLQGRGARTKICIPPQVCDVFSDLSENMNLEDGVKNSSREIEWNMWRSSIMSKSDICYFYAKLMKYGVWPVEILSQYKSKESFQKEKTAKSDKKSKPQTSKSTLMIDHFIAYLNLTPLLHPGVTKARVAAQLYTYSPADLLNKFGEDFGGSISLSSSSMVKNKTASRSKGSAIDNEEKKSGFEAPLFDEDGNPTFIIVEVELSKPINPKRNLEPLETDLKSYLSTRGKESKKTSNFQLMKNNFAQTVKNALLVLTEEYQKYSLSLKENDPNNEESFQQFLLNQENFFKIKSTLENKVVGLITEKFGVINQYKEKIPEIYVYLVNEMHKITNNCLLELNCISNPSYNNDDLQLYAEEAIEEGDYECAKDYLLLKVSRDPSNSNYWLDCAVYCIILKKYETAIEAVKEALCLNFNHQIGLLMFALLMAMVKNGTLAEITFEILLTKYPEYMEGWMSLSLFYFSIENNKGAMVARKEAEKINSEQNYLRKNKEEREENQEEEKIEKEKIEKELLDVEENCKAFPHNMENTKQGFYGVGSIRNGTELVESLSWSLSFCTTDRPYIKTAVLLQKLGFYEFAEMSLSNELRWLYFDPNTSVPYAYYKCVNYYLQGQYEEAVLLLQDLVKQYGKDCFLWSLMGHCYYKLQNHSSAISCYEYVIESFNRPDDIHLVYSRMGLYYNQVNKFECAKQVLKAACRSSPTPKLWKGLGIAFLRLEEIEEAETAFSEANYLDSTDSETWAYLGITNAKLQRLDLFQQCCLEAQKRCLRNPDLKKEIRALVLLHGLEGEEFLV